MNEERRLSWERIYIDKQGQLPWLEGEIPFDLLKSFTKLLPEDSRILDYGCGNGRLAEVVASAGCTLTCADISEHALELCQKRLIGFNQVSYQLADSPKAVKGKFDGILCWNVLHHVVDSEQHGFVNEIRQKLVAGGLLLISGFSPSDYQFADKKKRLSKTTNDLTYAIEADFFEGTGMQKDIISSGLVELKDGISGQSRAIQYFMIQNH